MGILDLWLPVLVATVVCFIASALIWTVIKWHDGDFNKTADEEGVRTALRGNQPGYYIVPYCMDQKEMNSPEAVQKYKEGPNAYITVIPNGMISMGPMLIGMVIYFLIISILCAYMVSRTVAPDADYLAVFRVAGFVAFVANGIGIIPESIWFGRPWKMTIKNLVDALVFGLLTGGVFGWLA